MIKKCIASLTAACFLFSFVAAPAVHAAIPPESIHPEHGEFLPSRLGMVTRLHDRGSAAVVVNIQDLHCHAEVQRNIAGILETLVDRYRLDRVYIEGASGDLDTSWLGGVKNAALKKEIADSLLRQGRLTGSEYYSSMSGRPRLLKGVENGPMHHANIVRLGRILEKSEDHERAIRQLKQDIDSLQARYFSSRNRRFSRLVELHRTGRISSPKYYAALLGYAEDVRANGPALLPGTENYPAISGYLQLRALEKRLNRRLAARQVSAFVGELRARLPWKDYNELLERTGDLSDFDAVCASLAPVFRRCGYDADRRFPELGTLFAFVELSRRVNPLELVAEERRLVETVRSALSRNEAEREVSFLVDFFGCFEEYLAARVPAEDYAYVAGRYEEFKKVLEKHAGTGRLAPLGPDVALLADYYRVNDDRTHVFLRSMFPGGVPAARHGNAIASPGTLLSGAREIIVIVTGGFHTEGLEKLLSEKGISSVVITPSVHEDTRPAEAAYRAIIAEQCGEFAAGKEGPAPALDAMQFAVETSRTTHLRALGLGLLGENDTIDGAHAAELGITVTTDMENGGVTLSDGTSRCRLILPRTAGRTLRSLPEAAFKHAKKIASTVLLKTGESTSLGYWAAKALFPYDTERQRSWGRTVVPLQTSALAVFFLLSPAAGIGALAGCFAVQQLLKLVAAKRSGEFSSPWRYIGSAFKDMAAFGLFTAVPASIGIGYAFLPFFVSNPLSFAVFSAFFVLSAVFNLHRLHALKWSSPALVATFALAGFVVAPVMGSIGALAMPVVAWTQAAAIVYALVTLAIASISRDGFPSSLPSRLRRALTRMTVCLLAVLLMFPARMSSQSFTEPSRTPAISSLWQGVPSLVNPGDILRVLANDPGYYESALSAYIQQLEDLKIRTFNDLSSDGSFGPLQRKVQDIMRSLPRDPVQRAEIAGHIRFSSEIQKRIFIDYGILVSGANLIDLVDMEKILAILPPEHYAGTTLIYFSPLHDQVEYQGMYYNIIGKSFIVMMDAAAYDTGAHEIGHANGPTAAFYALNALSGNDLENYAEQYGMRAPWEDWATIYEAWVAGSAGLVEKMGRSANLEAKVREVVKKFVITRDGQAYLRVFGTWNLSYTDVPFDGDVEHADLAALAAQAVVPDTIEARVLAEVSDHRTEGAKAVVEEELKDASPRQLYDLVYAVFSVSMSDAVQITRLIAEKGLVALPGQLTFDYIEANVHSWEDLVLLGNMAPGQVSAVLLSDEDRLYRLINSFPWADGRFLVYMGDKDDLPFMPLFFEALYRQNGSLAFRMLTRFPELITNVPLPDSMMAMAEDLLFGRVIDWHNPNTLEEMDSVQLEAMILDYALRLQPAPRAVFLEHVAGLYNGTSEGYGDTYAAFIRTMALLNDAVRARDYVLAGTLYDDLLGSVVGSGVNRWTALGFFEGSDLHEIIWSRAKTDPLGALHLISERQEVLLGEMMDLDFLSEHKALAIEMLKADPAAALKILEKNPFLGKLIAKGSPEDAAFVVDVIKAVGPGVARAGMNAYYWSRTSNGEDSGSPQAAAILASYAAYAGYLPASDQELYRSVLEGIGGKKPPERVGTMIINKAQARRWVSEGRSGMYIAVRLTLRETVARMFAPEKKFIAGHAEEDKPAARSIVRAGKWGGIISAAVSAGLLGNLASSSPLSLLLFVTLSGAAGWVIGSFVAGGIRQIAIDAAAYGRMRIPPVKDDVPGVPVSPDNYDDMYGAYSGLLSAS